MLQLTKVLIFQSLCKQKNVALKQQGRNQQRVWVFGKKKKYKIITNSMSLQNMSILTQPQPWQESAGVQHMLSLDQTLKDNKADASTRQPVQQKPIASTCRYRFPCRALEKGWGLRQCLCCRLSGGIRRRETGKAGSGYRVVCWGVLLQEDTVQLATL